MNLKINEAKIIAKASATDPVSQEFTVRRDTDGELQFFHRQIGDWCKLPSEWQTRAEEALAPPAFSPE